MGSKLFFRIYGALQVYISAFLKVSTNADTTVKECELAWKFETMKKNHRLDNGNGMELMQMELMRTSLEV